MDRDTIYGVRYSFVVAPVACWCKSRFRRILQSKGVVDGTART
jgi:hypothetical protein